MKRSQKLSENEINNLKEMMKILGLEYYESLNEADPTLAFLNRTTEKSFIVSNDSDFFLYDG